MIERACPDDLLVQRRQRELSDLERRALAAHLAQCDLCRASETMAAILHEGRDVLPGDEDLIARVAARASAAASVRARGQSPGRRVRLAVAAVILLFAGGGAFAWVGARWRPTSTTSTTSVAARTAESEAGEARPRRRKLAPVEAEDPAPSRSPTEEPPAAPSPPPRAPASLEPPAARAISEPQPAAELAAPAPTAASLFRDANAVRRAGDLSRAADVYVALRRQFPRSAEARLASISLGDLLIDLDAPARALGAFDAYLAEVRSGALREEALFGRARCLKMLGKAGPEAETWRTLLEDFPSSAYEPLARTRLKELPK